MVHKLKYLLMNILFIFTTCIGKGLDFLLDKNKKGKNFAKKLQE